MQALLHSPTPELSDAGTAFLRGARRPPLPFAPFSFFTPSIPLKMRFGKKKPAPQAIDDDYYTPPNLNASYEAQAQAQQAYAPAHAQASFSPAPPPQQQAQDSNVGAAAMYYSQHPQQPQYAQPQQQQYPPPQQQQQQPAPPAANGYPAYPPASSPQQYASPTPAQNGHYAAPYVASAPSASSIASNSTNPTDPTLATDAQAAQPQQQQQSRRGKEFMPYRGKPGLVIAIDLGTTYSEYGARSCVKCCLLMVWVHRWSIVLHLDAWQEAVD